MLTISLLTSFSIKAQKTRSKIEDKYKWNFTDLYKNDEEWTKAKDAFVEKTKKIADFKGKLGESSKTLLEFLQFDDEISKEGSKLYIYTSLKADQDVSNQANQALEKIIQQVFIKLGQESAFVQPEIAAIPEETMKQYIFEEPGLKTYKLSLMDTYRMKPHTLSEPEELIMAKAGLTSETASSTYSVF